MASAHRHPTVLVARELAMPLEAGLVLMGIVTIVVGAPATAVWMLAIWALAALLYIGIAVRRLKIAAGDPDMNRIEFSEIERCVGVWSHAIHVDVAIIAFSSLSGVLGAVSVLRDASSSDHVALSRIVAALSILGAWLLLQFGFCRLYADSWRGDEKLLGLDFPGTNQPGLIEFAYFTFSIGATYQTSDTSVTSTHMRWLVTIHAVICFVYNTVLLAFAVSLILNN